MPENQNLNNEQQETTPSGNKIYILSRNNYDNWQGSYGNNIFFVRENSADQDKMVSVYVGESKQSNIVVTDESDIWNRTTNDYTIPEKYQVSDKLFLIKRTLATETEQETPDNTIYGIVTWNGERFIDCGIPNNVIVLTDIEEGISDLSQWLSQNITGIKDFIYIIPNYHSIYYYDGANGYISIISVDSFVTVEMLNEVASRIPVADELTVLSKVSNSQTVFSAAGADLSGKMVIVGSDDPVEASPGATIFNNYNPTPVSGKQGYKYGTTAIGAYSSAFGTANVTKGANSVAFGSSNTILGNSSVSFGSSNNISVSGVNSLVSGAGNYLTTSQSLICGTGNRLNADSGGTNNNIIGTSNIVHKTGYSASKVHVFGDSNTIGSTLMANAIGGSTYIIGQGNTAGPNGIWSDNTYIFGWNNKAGVTGQNFGGNSILVGQGLITQIDDHASSSYSPMLYMGKFNTGNHHDIVIANGVSTSDTFDAISIDGDIIKVNPDRYVRSGSSFQGDLVSGHGTSLTLRTGTIRPSSQSITGTYQVNYLPVNNSITSVIWDNANKLEFMLNNNNEFEFRILTNNAGETITLDQTTDYSCLLVIPKLNSFNSASDIIVNFTANDASKIYLLNPDIDISSYTTIHILLFYDLSNLCAIVSGYQEVTNP